MPGKELLLQQQQQPLRSRTQQHRRQMQQTLRLCPFISHEKKRRRWKGWSRQLFPNSKPLFVEWCTVRVLRTPSLPSSSGHPFASLPTLETCTASGFPWYRDWDVPPFGTGPHHHHPRVVVVRSPPMEEPATPIACGREETILLLLVLVVVILTIIILQQQQQQQYHLTKKTAVTKTTTTTHKTTIHHFPTKCPYCDSNSFYNNFGKNMNMHVVYVVWSFLFFLTPEYSFFCKDSKATTKLCNAFSNWRLLRVLRFGKTTMHPSRPYW